MCAILERPVHKLGVLQQAQMRPNTEALQKIGTVSCSAHQLDTPQYIPRK